MISIDEIFDVLSSLELKNRFGIAGSFARGTAKKSSDIDIVIDTDCLDIMVMEQIKITLKSKFNRKSDVLCLDLLRQEDEKLDNLSCSLGLGKNEYSAYKTILRDVIWNNKIA